MKQQFDNTIEKLNSDPYWAVTVVDKDSLKKVVINATGEDLTAQHGSVEDFFEKLHQDNINSIHIFDRRKTGSAFRPLSDYAVSLVEKKEPETLQKAEPSPPPAPAYQQPVPGLGNSFGGLMGGLSMPEAIYKTQDHSRMQGENIELKAENKRLYKEVEELKEKNLRNEILGTKSVESKNANAEMVKTISESPVLAALASKFLNPASTPGLGMPDQNLSHVKQQMIGSLSQADDSFVSDLFSVARGMSESVEFDNELAELLKKYNLTPETNA